LRAVAEAAEAGIIIPTLVGPKASIAALARQHRIDISRFELIDAVDADEAAAQGVKLIHEVKGELLMKGSLHTDELMRAVTASATGLRTARRISHVFVMDVPTYPEPLLITDAAINIFPDLDAKRDIIQNAIDLFTQAGLGTPRVAIVSAVETVTSKIPSTIEAAALCKMAERGQITGGVLDGPLAFDNAIDPEAAKIKGIHSPVAGLLRSWSCPTSRPATCSPRTFRSWPRPTRPESCSGRAYRSSSPRGQIPSAPAWPPARWRSYMRTPDGAPRSCRPRDQHGNDPRRQCGLVEPQVADVRARRPLRHTLSVLSRDVARALVSENVARRRFAS
jgi:hypothetical protein